MAAIFSIIDFILIVGRKMNKDNSVSIPMVLSDTLKFFRN